jgi:hypothetical protein
MVNTSTDPTVKLGTKTEDNLRTTSLTEVSGDFVFSQEYYVWYCGIHRLLGSER